MGPIKDLRLWVVQAESWVFKRKWASCLMLFLCLVPAAFSQSEDLQTGDIIFQTSQSRQSEAIRIATDSRYSHVGMIVEENGKMVVLEAVQPVKITPLREWINRGEKGHYVVKRLKSPELSVEQQHQLNEAGRQYLGLNYDIYFSWEDNEMYCSELVWKVYEEVLGVELGSLRELGDFHLDHPLVAMKLKERYGSNVPLEERVISPEDIFESELLRIVED